MTTLNRPNATKLLTNPIYNKVLIALSQGQTVWQYDVHDERTGWFIITHLDLGVPDHLFRIQDEEPAYSPQQPA